MTAESETARNKPPLEFEDPALPMIAVEDFPRCAICGNSNSMSFAEGYDYEIRTCRNLWQFVQCVSCQHVWLNPRPAISTLSVIYPKTYYAYSYDRINPIALRAKAFLDERKIGGILRDLNRPVSGFLDIGCGDGRFLKAMERRGVGRPLNFGLELDESTVKILTDQGYRVFCERVETCQRIPEGSLDLITMFHVIEHVSEPGEVIRQTARWLKKGGILAVETPNLDSLDARLFHDRFWGGYHFPRHWHLFTAGTLTALIEQHGLKVIRASFQTGHSFWMYSFHHWLRYFKSRKKLSCFFNPFTSLLPLASFTVWDKLRAALGFRTSAMLLIAVKQ